MAALVPTDASRSHPTPSCPFGNNGTYAGRHTFSAVFGVGMGREPPKPELIKRHNHALIEIAYKSKQSGETKVFRGSWTTLEVREDGTYFVEVYDETDGSIRIADTADGGVAKNHKLTTLGPLEKLDVYGLVKV